MTPADVARRVGVDPRTVERWITTGRAPYPVHQHAVGQALGASADELWPRRSQRQVSPDANEELREALFRARLTPARVASALELDPKTVERWVTKGRLPYPRHRAAVSEMVDVPEAELWPQVNRGIGDRIAANDLSRVWERYAEAQIQAKADEMRRSLGLRTASSKSVRSARDDERAQTLADQATASAPIKDADIHPDRGNSPAVEVDRYRTYSRGRGVERKGVA